MGSGASKQVSPKSDSRSSSTVSELSKRKNASASSKTDSFKGNAVEVLANSLQPTTDDKAELQKENSEDLHFTISSLREKVQILENSLNKSESQRLDLEDQLQIKNSSEEKSVSTNSISETDNAKYVYIEKLESDLETLKAESLKMKRKLKKKIRNLTSQLFEAKQEASISKLEQSTKNNEDSFMDKASKLNSTTEAQETGHARLVLELSTQALEDKEKISTLEDQLNSKDKLIAELHEKLKNAEQESDHFKVYNKAISDVVHRKLSPSLNNSPVENVSENNTIEKFDYGKTDRQEATIPTCYNDFSCSKQASVLSDSDSDWDVPPVQSQAHSAPANARTKHDSSYLDNKLRPKSGNLTYFANDDSIRSQDFGYKLPMLKDTTIRTQKRLKSKAFLDPSPNADNKYSTLAHANIDSRSRILSPNLRPCLEY